MDNCWISPFIPPRPSVVGGSNFMQWPIDPDAPSGSGDTPVEGTPGPFQLLTDINITSDKLYSVPGMGLKFDTEIGGDMSGGVEWHDDSVKTGENLGLAQLIATPVSTSYVVSASATASCSGTGTFYSSWSALALPIPVMTGKVYGLSAYLFGIFYGGAYNNDRRWVATGHLEFGDVDSNVVGSVDVATFNSAELYKGLDGGGFPITEVNQSQVCNVSAGDNITISGIATKIRCKAVVTTFIYTSSISVRIPYASSVRG